MVLTNLPMIYPLIKRWYEKGMSGLGSSSPKNGKSSGNNGALYDSKGYKLDSRPTLHHSKSGHNNTTITSRSHHNHNPLTVPWGSEENIIQDSDSGNTIANIKNGATVEEHDDAKTTRTSRGSRSSSDEEMGHGHVSGKQTMHGRRASISSPSGQQMQSAAPQPSSQRHHKHTAVAMRASRPQSQQGLGGGGVMLGSSPGQGGLGGGNGGIVVTTEYTVTEYSEAK